MVRRQVHQNIALDQSLRQSRTIWLSLALVFLPFAIFGFFAVVAAFDLANTPNPLWNLFWGITVIAADGFSFARVFEASDRIRMLREDPSAKVRPLPAPFQASLFGPYH